jgi:RimJ/RimL family protein N-acetyltransferase
VGYITEEMQRRWYESYLENENDLVFAIEETDELKRVVGSLSLYDWDKENNTVEIGRIQIGDSGAHGKGIGRKTLVMAMKIAFRKLGITKIVASVHPNNIQAYKNDMAIGFQVVGETTSVVGGNELLLEMTEEDARNTNAYYDEIIV